MWRLKKYVKSGLKLLPQTTFPLRNPTFHLPQKAAGLNHSPLESTS